MRLEDYDLEKRYTATVKETASITPESSEDEIRNIVLNVDKKDFSFDVGQCVGVLVPGPHPFGQKDHFRLYTVANIQEPSNGDDPRLEICVKRCFSIDDVSGEGSCCPLDAGEVGNPDGNRGQGLFRRHQEGCRLILAAAGGQSHLGTRPARVGQRMATKNMPVVDRWIDYIDAVR